MNRNCPNCGAPYDIELNTCPYCNTLYFDMSAIDLEERKPIYLKIKANGMIMTQKCIPTLGTIEVINEPIEITDVRGSVIKQIVGNRYCTTNITFEAIPDYGKSSLYTVTEVN